VKYLTSDSIAAHFLLVFFIRQVDPVTGETKKKLGGNYPGNRRPQQAPYVPPQTEFHKVDGDTAQATAHFVAYGGGNALVLVDQANAPPQLATGAPQKEYIQGKLSGLEPNIYIYLFDSTISVSFVCQKSPCPRESIQEIQFTYKPPMGV
jgi:hypothetical protein